MAESGKAIRVTFLDDRTGATLGEVDLEPERLPESFELDTTLHIGDAEWSVVDAQPGSREEYTRIGELILRLVQVEQIDPGRILFSLPSICDYIPGTGDHPLVGDEHLLTEDDWRQFELIDAHYADEADTEIAAIRSIHERAWANPGWREIHIRKNPGVGISRQLSLERAVEAFGGRIRGLAYAGGERQIEDGYAMTATDGLTAYGIAPQGDITVLAIAKERLQALPENSMARIEALASTYGLHLVDWCRCARAAAGDPLFRQLLVESVT